MIDWRISFIAALSFIASCADNNEAERLNGDQEQVQRPNIIFVLVDDQRFDAIGKLNPQISTPNMDRMIDQGIHFRNAFVTTSLCSPSRATILTGMSTRNHGIVGNAESEPAELVFFPTYLQDVGYNTALIGKWHMGYGAEKRDGFDHWVSFSGQGHYHPEDASGDPSILNVNGTEVLQQGYITDELTDYAIDWISDAGDRDQPFFLHLAHKAVHADFSPPERHVGNYDNVEFVHPIVMESNSENYANKPRWLKDQRNSVIGVDYAYYSSATLTDIQRRYYSALSAVDESIGRIIEHLERTGLAENTIVFVMGDNGFLFGEFGLIDKRVAYDPSMRVPLIVWGPGRLSQGIEVSEVVANLDIAPTVMSLAGLPAPEHFEGGDMSDLLRNGHDDDWANEVIYEYYWDYWHPQTPTTFAIRTEQFKFITYHGVWDVEELYDIVNDPQETNNLVWDEAYADPLESLRKRLYAALQNNNGARVIPYEEKTFAGRIWRSPSGSKPGAFPANFVRAPSPEESLLVLEERASQE